MSSLLFKTDGYVQSIEPKDSNKFSLDELQGYVHGHIEVVPLPGNQLLVCNDEGKIQGLPINRFATLMVKEHLQPNDFLVGDVLIINSNQLD